MAEPADLEALLVIQGHDTTIDQLRHRRSTLPERAALVEHEKRSAELAERLNAVVSRREDLSRSQKRLEDEVASIEEKAQETDRRLHSGAVGAPRELQAMQDGIDAMHRRQSALEDEVLEIMELAEPVDEELARLRTEEAELAAEGERLHAALDAAAASIDADLAAEEAARAEAAAGVTADLLATYETSRDRHDGIGVARLDGNRCGGCHLTLPATEVDQLKRQPPGTVLRHDECGRILVRV